ncbi:MAG: amino acid adenylation domain-containing protein, partial [Ginsengibacter sp.]
MKSNHFNKTFIAKTGKGIIDLINSRQSELSDIEVLQPTDEIEILFLIWKSLLGHSNFDENDDFFQVGGNSLKAVQLVSRISKQFSVNVQLTDIFLQPSMARQAILIQEKKQNTYFPSSIEVHSRPDRIPLSFNQERIWFLDQLEGSLAYHIPAVLRLKGSLDKDALINAFQNIINRHEVLRTLILQEEGQPYQFIQGRDQWKLLEIDGTSSNKKPDPLPGLINQLINKPFDLSHDYMMRVHLVYISDEEYLLVITLHHIASDGWSTSIIIKELVELYSSFGQNRDPELVHLDIQYADFAIWQRQLLKGQLLEKKLEYWKRKLEGLEPLQLQTDFVRPLIQNNIGAIKEFNIDKELSEQLQLFSQKHGVTLFMTLFSTFKVLLYRYSGQQDICVGTVIAGRTQQEVENMIGFFANTLALRSNMAGDRSFTDFLQEIKSTTLEALQHQDVPFEKVVEAVVKERDLSRNPLFQVMFVLQNTPDKQDIHLGEVVLSEEPFQNNKAKFELDLNITETTDGLRVTVEYCSDLYNEETINRMMIHYDALLKAVVENPEQIIGLLPMLSIDEERQLLLGFNDTFVDYPKDKTIIDLFEDQAAAKPFNIALVFESEELTYRELNERANQLAHYLRSRGVQEETLVPVCMERGAAMIISMMGILKAGGAYVPIDPEYPGERISYLLEDTGAQLLLSSSTAQMQRPAGHQVEIIHLDTGWSTISKQPVHNLSKRILPSHLAYIIYTSGSTGRPKGVMVEHQALMDHCYGVIKSAELEKCSSFALFSPLVFDAGHSIIFANFLLGASLHVLSKQLLAHGGQLATYLINNEIDCIKIVPSLWLSYADENHFVLGRKVIIFGGDTFSVTILDRLRKIGYSGIVYNHYGPTEATIGKTIHQVDLGKVYTTVPIGKPFSNTALYITDEGLQLVPVGVAGELYIAGDGLARAYLNQPELTTDKFVENPFNKGGFTRMYKTGDQVRWLPDGNIEYLGRVDEQVKIRGHRIELGEIESLLQEFDEVSQVVVLAKEDYTKNKRLVAYIVPNEGFTKVAAATYLKSRLPDYMIPALWVEMEVMPLTTNGKINRKALPEPDISTLRTEYEAPRTETERVLTEIWQQLLNVQQ